MDKLYTYKPLTDVSYKQIHEAFGKAFADYVLPFKMSLEELIFMIERRGYKADISFGAFYNEELVGFTLNGLGKWNGKLTAYDTGTGVVKEHRKKGIAKQIFEESLPALKENHVKQYLLEVIDTNTPAIDLYKKMGFEEVRKLDFQIVKIDDLKFENRNRFFEIIEIKDVNLNEFTDFWNNTPSWQNSIESVNRKIDSFTVLGAKKENEIIGYGVIQKTNGDVPQIAVKNDFRQKGVASAILQEMVKYSMSGEFRFINSIHADEETNKFFEKLEIKKGGGQLEMIKIL